MAGLAKFFMTPLETFKRDLTGYGYNIPKDVRFWKINTGKHMGQIGMQVGQYSHSCHIETTDFVVLVFFKKSDELVRNLKLKAYSDYFDVIEIK